jgi:hypothetical protein
LTGAFRRENVLKGKGTDGHGYVDNLYFDASLSNSIYGASTTVQPPAVTMLPCIKAFDAPINQGLVDVSALAQAFTAYLPLSGGTMTGVITSTLDRGFYHEGTTGLGFSAKNVANGKMVTFGVGTSGSKGIYDDDDGSWMFQKDASGNYKIGDMSIKAVVTETYRSGMQWYRVWSDGWIEQGGYLEVSSNTVTITFHKAFNSGDYFTLALPHGGASEFGSKVRTTTNFTLQFENKSNNGVFWYACGF